MARVHEPHTLRVGVVGCGRMGCAIAGERQSAASVRVTAALRPCHAHQARLTDWLCWVLVAGEFVRRGCSVTLYDHTEYTRTRAFQTLRASLWDHVCAPM